MEKLIKSQCNYGVILNLEKVKVGATNWDGWSILLSHTLDYMQPCPAHGDANIYIFTF